MDNNIDAHARQPEKLRDVFRAYKSATVQSIDNDENIFDSSAGRLAGFRLTRQAGIDGGPATAFRSAPQKVLSTWQLTEEVLEKTRHAYEHHDLPGLLIYPVLLPPSLQLSLLDSLVHEHVSNPRHNNNIGLHYDTSSIAPTNAADQPAISWFHPSHAATVFRPKDPQQHKPLSMSKALSRSLRWVTLGGQYDWTAKRYPPTTPAPPSDDNDGDDNGCGPPPPPFPPALAALIITLFPSMAAQAAILNVYRPGDTLSPHRDVSEACARPLVSVSLGCDGLFVVAPSAAGSSAEGGGIKVLRLRSGDVLVMSGEARWAWHGVPRVLGGTCPGFLEGWPAAAAAAPAATGEGGDGEQRGGNGEESGSGSLYEAWRGWMRERRINLNVRQMYD